MASSEPDLTAWPRTLSRSAQPEAFLTRLSASSSAAVSPDAADRGNQSSQTDGEVVQNLPYDRRTARHGAAPAKRTTLMRSATITATLAALLAIAAPTTAQTISFDFDKSIHFGGFKTYGWVPGTNVPDQLVHRRIVDAVDGQLTSKGMTKAPKDAHPDVFVAYHASFEKDLQITGFGSGWGGYRFGGTRSGSARAEEIVVGTMVIDIVDAETNNIVWRGTATKDIDVNAKPDKRDKNIAKTAEKLFKYYPPKS
jgi:Domain of unknown function (DUF4136)